MISKKAYILLIVCGIILCDVSLGVAQRDVFDRNIKIEVVIKKAGYHTAVSGESTLKQETRQEIVVLNNHEATLFVGKRVPYVNWFRDYLHRSGYLEATVDFRDVGTQLKVRPRIVQGNIIEVTVTPEISYETVKGYRDIKIDRLSTTVMVSDGESIILGGSATKEQFERQFNEYFYKDETGEAVIVTLTPRIME
ncbi:MAG: hypothetical protein PHE61_04370 [Candidatus Omnitrophica bacterium]|nr:hypothetical protein [Candidatus Omnitrophota bacterium]